VKGGTVVTAVGASRADVLIEGERILAVGSGVDLPADREIDAEGCLVLPGLVDNHTHLGLPTMGTVTAAGGTTTIVDFATQTDGSLLKGLETWHGRAAGKAHVDYAFHMAVVDATPEAIDEMEGVADEGVTSFKVYMAYKGSLMIDDGEMLRVLRRAGEIGGLVCVHAENGDVIDANVRAALAAGHTAPHHHALTRPAEVEAEATARAIRLADWAGAPVFIVHVTCEPALREIESARAHGAQVLAETCVQYLALTAEELERPGFEGAKFVCSPPLRTPTDQDALWAGLARGALQGCSTDHCSFNYKGQKELGRDDFSKIPNGLPTIESRLPLLYELGVMRGRLDLTDLVRVSSTGPAQVFGLAPRKGTIAPGADADVVVLDPGGRTTLSGRTHHMNVDYSPFEGTVCRGSVRTVLGRGEVLVEDGELRSRPGRGRFVARERHDAKGGR
jgi:dihydropyrimidinase